MAGDEEQRDLVLQLLGGERLAVLLRVDELGEQVVARVGPLPLDRRGAVGVEVAVGDHRVARLLDAEDRIERLDDRVGPVAELVAIGVGHPEHLGDHGERQREREVGDDVHLAGRGHGVERVVDELGDLGAQLAHALGGEHLAHELADAGVVRGIDVEDAAGRGPELDIRVGLEQLGEAVRRGVGVDRLGLGDLDAQMRVAQELEAVVVGEEHPRVDGAEVHRIGGAHPRVLVVGVVEEAGFERVEEHLFAVGRRGQRELGHGSPSGARPRRRSTRPSRARPRTSTAVRP